MAHGYCNSKRQTNKSSLFNIFLNFKACHRATWSRPNRFENICIYRKENIILPTTLENCKEER
jgi:hypothetical protein